MANFFDQFDTAAPDAQAGPANFFDQFDAPKAAAAAVPGQISIPGLGTPSLIGMAKGVWEAAKGGVTLPRDVYQGKVDPLSEQGIGRATELASLTMLPSAGRTMAAKAGTAPAVAELQTAARPIYRELTEAGNTVAVEGKGIAQSLAEELHPQALRPASAPRTYNELNGLSRAKDLNDVAIARDNLRDVANGIADNRLVRVAGQDSAAARQAMQTLDKKMDELSPGWSQKMAEADANWAASKRVEKVQKEADKGQKGRLGSFDTNEIRAKGYTAEEIAAIKKAHQGGVMGTFLNAVGGGLNPFHGGLAGTVSAAMHLPAALASGGLSLAGIPVGVAADAAAKMLRQQALRQAIEKISSRSPLAKTQSPRSVIQLPPISVSPTMGLLPFEGSSDLRRIAQ